MTVSEQLRRAIKESHLSYYRIAKDAGVDWSTLQRFVDRSRPDIRVQTVDKLCAYLGMELRAAGGQKGRVAHQGQSKE